MDNANAPDLGAGPYTVREVAGCFSVMLGGKVVKGPYGAGKTAYRAARELNSNPSVATIREETAVFLDDTPVNAPFDDPRREEDRRAIERSKRSVILSGGDVGVGDAPASPKAPKSRKARPDVRVKPAAKPKAPNAEGPAPKFGTRDEWLNAFIAAARPIFKAADLELPEKVRASIGWMFRSSNKKTLGQCWHEASSADGTREIWINPILGNLDSFRIADVLTHELAHTLFGPDEKHGKNFKAAVHKLGLKGKATATTAGPEWLAWATPILEELGPIPHAALDPALSGVAKKKTYLLKATCGLCDFTFRATAKHLNGKALRCPDVDCGGDVEVEGSEDLGEGDGE